MNSIDYSQLFHLSDPLANQPLRFSFRREQQDWLTAENEIKLLYGQWQPPEPVIMKASMGGQVKDILWSTSLLICISQRIVDLLLDNRFTGWSTFPVEVYDRKGEPLPGYYGLAIPSFAGEQDISRSEIITKPAPSEKGKPYTVYKGLFFDESKWDGSDFFRVTHAHKVVTKRVKDAFTKSKIKNVMFTALTEFEIMTYIVDMRRKSQKEKQDSTS